MKKSFINRSLQVASAVAVYTAISVWSSTADVHLVTDAITSLNSFLVTLAIALIFPYFCFNVLAKLYTPPKSRNLDDTSVHNFSEIDQDDQDENVAISQDLESMQYRGIYYHLENSRNLENSKDVTNQRTEKPLIKYRGASITRDSEKYSQNPVESFASERESQKSAKPKDRIKYRGSYVD